MPWCGVPRSRVGLGLHLVHPVILSNNRRAKSDAPTRSCKPPVPRRPVSRNESSRRRVSEGRRACRGARCPSLTRRVGLHPVILSNNRRAKSDAPTRSCKPPVPRRPVSRSESLRRRVGLLFGYAIDDYSLESVSGFVSFLPLPMIRNSRIAL